MPNLRNEFVAMQSYANAIVSSAEDPEKLLDQTVLEMNEDLIKMRQASAQVRDISLFLLRSEMCRCELCIFVIDHLSFSRA